MPPEEQCRMMAVGLAIIATLWGVYCLFFIAFGAWPAVLVLVPGYALTAGYYWRGFGKPSFGWARAIWLSSLVVQGTWLAVALCWGKPRNASEWILVAWWALASAYSAIGFLLERRRPAAV
jgi:hypothetical protein